MRSLYAYAVLTLALAMALGYALAVARVPFIEGTLAAFGFGMAWNSAMPWFWKRIRRAMR